MNYHQVGQLLSSNDLLVHSHSFERAINNMNLINEKLSPSFSFPTHPDYQPTFPQKTLFFFTFALTSYDNEGIRETALNLVQHWSFILASVSPGNFLNTVSDMLLQKDAVPIIHHFIPAMAHAVKLLGDEAISYFKIIHQVFTMVKDKQFLEVPNEIWDVIGKFAPEEEITKIINQKLSDHSFADKLHLLLKKNTKALSKILFRSSPGSVLQVFLSHCTGAEDLDINEFIARVNSIASNCDHEDFDHLMLSLSRIININRKGFTDGQVNAIKEILDKISRFLDKEGERPALYDSIVSALVEATNKNIFPRENLNKINEKLILKSDHFSQSVLLKSLFLCLDLQEEKSKLFKLMISINSWNTNAFVDLLTFVSENFTYLNQCDEKYFNTFLFYLFNPFPTEPKSVIAILNFLLKIDPNVLLNPKLNVRPDILIPKLLNSNNDEIVDLGLKLAKKTKIYLQICDIDFFGKNAGKQLSRGIDINFLQLKEIINSRILLPEHRYAIFQQFQQYPTYFISLINSLIGLLHQIAVFLGVDMDHIYAKQKISPVYLVEIYITNDELQSLFSKIKGPISESDFGIFVHELLIALECMVVPEANLDDGSLSALLFLCAHLSSMFPTGCLHIIGKIFSFQKNTKSEILKNNLSEVKRLILLNRFPSSYSVDVAYYSCMVYGYKRSLSHFPKLITDAISKSRYAINLFKHNLEQPFAPMPTFLTIANDPKHEEYANICQEVIDPNDWVLSPEDRDVINNLPRKENSDMIHKIALRRLDKLIQEKMECPYITSQLNFRSVNYKHYTGTLRIKEGPKAHESEESGTLYGLTSFLWHSSLPLPNSIQPSELEEFVLSQSQNPKLLIGFFNWAKNNDYKIYLEKWADTFTIKKYTEIWILALAYFLSNIHCPFSEIPPSIIIKVHKCISSFGYPFMTKQSLIQGYLMTNGVEWLIFKNLLLIDPSFFSDFPLIVAELTNDINLFKQCFSDLKDDQLLKILMSFNNILFKPKQSEMKQTMIFPTNFYTSSKMMSFRVISQIPEQIHIQDDLIEAIINSFSKLKNVPYSFFPFFMNIKLNKEQFGKVYDMFFVGRNSTSWTRKFLLPAVFLDENGTHECLEGDAIRFYSDKPPSIARGFYRSLVCSFAPPIKQNLIHRVETKLTKIFPALHYKGFVKLGDDSNIWSNALPITLLKYGFLDSHSWATLQSDLTLPCREAIEIYSSLCDLSDDALASVQNWATKGMIRDEITNILLHTITANEASLVFVREAVQMLVQKSGIENVMIHIGNKEFLNRPNFLNAVVAFMTIFNISKTLEDKTAYEFLKIFLEPETNVITNEENLKLFTGLSDEANITKIIHQ